MFLEADGVDARVGEPVLVPTEHGDEVATCVWGPAQTSWDDAPLPVCPGKASEADRARDAARAVKRAEIAVVSQALIDRLGLPMKVLAVDLVEPYSDADRLSIIYFSAPHRVDFRTLLGELARNLQSRIDLRQVGARDIAALIGDVGPCGRTLCCVAMSPVTQPVVVRDVEGNIPAGQCGRYACCSVYEQ